MPEYALNLWDYWRIIYKRKWIIISVFLVSVASSYLFVEKVVPIYKASVTIYINTRRTPVAEVTGTGVTFWGGGGEDLSTQLELIRSFNILQDVALRLGYITPDMDSEKVQAIVASLRGKISVEEQTATELVTISVIDTDPFRAKKIVDVVAEVFMQKRWDEQVKDAKATKEFVEKQLRKMSQTIADIRKKLKSLGVDSTGGKMPAGEVDLRVRLAQLELELSNLRERYTDNYPGIINRLAEIRNIKKHLKQSPPEEGELDVETLNVDDLENELEINKKLYALLKERYEKALIMEASKAKDTQIVNPAVVPKSPVNAQRGSNVLLAAAIGLVLGLVAAFVVESLDTSIGTIEDVEEYLEVPVLGVIPQIEIDKKEQADYWKKPLPPEEEKRYAEIMRRLVVLYQPKSSMAEAYKNLQTYIKFSGLNKVGNCLMFTSAGIQEGKTITAVNSALSMAQMGYKVLLVDADLRRPAVHEVFGIGREMGLTEIVLGTFKLDDVIKSINDMMMGNIKSSVLMKTPGIENLHIITAGHLPANPSEVLGSESMSEFIKEVKAGFQVVLFDSAPVLPVPDSTILGSKMDGIIIVYKAGRTSRLALRRCKLQIENAKGKPIGVVLNSMRASDMRFGSPSYYYYQKYYGEQEEKKT